MTSVRRWLARLMVRPVVLPAEFNADRNDGGWQQEYVGITRPPVIPTGRQWY
jgi:hypothetical protein